MIRTKQELSFYIKADRVMNGFPASAKGFVVFIRGLLPHPKKNIIKFLKYMRLCDYYTNGGAIL